MELRGNGVPAAFVARQHLNPTLVRDVYAAQAKEARASGVHVICTVFPEPARDPRPGRVIELYSECRYLTGRMIEAVVTGSSAPDPAARDKIGVILIDFPASSAPVGGLECGRSSFPSAPSARPTSPAEAPASAALGVMAAWNSIDGAGGEHPGRDHEDVRRLGRLCTIAGARSSAVTPMASLRERAGPPTPRLQSS